MTDVRVNINSSVYEAAFSRGWESSLAVFVMLCYKYPHKRVRINKKNKTVVINSIANEVGLSKNTLRKHLEVLRKKQLISIKKKEILIKSNRQINKKYKLKKQIYVKNLSNIKTILTGLKSLKVRSFCLGKLKKSKEKLHLDMMRGKDVAEPTTDLTISNRELCHVLRRREKKTAKRFKNYCRNNIIMDFKRNFKEVSEIESYEKYLEMVKYKADRNRYRYSRQKVYYEYENIVTI